MSQAKSLTLVTHQITKKHCSCIDGSVEQVSSISMIRKTFKISKAGYRIHSFLGTDRIAALVPSTENGTGIEYF